MFDQVDLILIDRQLTELQSTPYFDESSNAYVRGLRSVAARLRENPPPLSPALVREMVEHLWQALTYMKGSVSREIPYEVCCSVELALHDWVLAPGPSLFITTALIDEKNYHLQEVDARFYVISSSYLNIDFEARPLLMALPRLYKHQPLLNVTLYHEMGHFVDGQIGISKLAANILSRLVPTADAAVLQNHFAEYFCDLFAATYTGGVISDALDHLAPDAAESYSHPATNDRRRVVEGFLKGAPEREQRLFDFVLDRLKRPRLGVKFKKPNLTVSFGNMRPAVLTSPAELHGLFAEAIEFYGSVQRGEHQLWRNISALEAARFINDLVEKSIRNWLIQKKWAGGAAVRRAAT